MWRINPKIFILSRMKKILINIFFLVITFYTRTKSKQSNLYKGNNSKRFNFQLLKEYSILNIKELEVQKFGELWVEQAKLKLNNKLTKDRMFFGKSSWRGYWGKYGV